MKLHGIQTQPERNQRTFTHLLRFSHPAVPLQAADLPLQTNVCLLQTSNFFEQLADVLQVAQAQSTGSLLLGLQEQNVCISDKITDTHKTT